VNKRSPPTSSMPDCTFSLPPFCGILSDAILGVRSIPLDSIQPSLPTLTGIRAAYLKGVTSDRLVILDAGALLADRKLIVLEEVEGDNR
jgi:purine-binding chemotaxis protein CheW